MGDKTLIVLLLLFAVACTPTDDIRIGGVFHLTGDGALWGETELHAVQLALEEINAKGGVNGKRIELIIEDGATDYAQTTTALQKLVNVNQVPVVLGPTWFGQASAPIAEENQVVMITPSAGITTPREKYYFNMWTPEDQEAIPLARHMARSGIERVVVVYSLNDWSVSMSREFIAEAEKLGITIVDDIATDGFETDFATVVMKIKTLDVDAVMGPIAFISSQGSFSKELAKQGVNIPVYSGSGMEIPALVEAFPEVEGTIYSYPAVSASEKEFQERYQERFGFIGSPSAANAYDATHLLAEVMREVGTDSTTIAEALEGRTFEGVNTFTLTDGRVQTRVYDIKQIVNGGFVILED